MRQINYIDSDGTYTSVNQDLRKEIKNMIMTYKPKNIKTTNEEMKIIVKDDEPIYHTPRQLPFTGRDIVDRQVEEWLKDGIIEPRVSEYSSQVVVTMKKDGSPRIYIADHGRLYQSEENTKAVVNYLEPTNIKRIKSFLGLTGYLRKFIPYYSLIARPLSDLLKKNIKFIFEDDQRNALNKLKQVMSEKPALNVFKEGGDLELHTDASQVTF